MAEETPTEGTIMSPVKQASTKASFGFINAFLAEVKRFRNLQDPKKPKFSVKRLFLAVPHFVTDWLKVYEPRWRTMIATLLLVALVATTIIYGGNSSQASSFTFTQTNWSGGENAGNATHPGDQSSWNKYSSQNNIDFGTAGALKAGQSSKNFTESFDNSYGSSRKKITLNNSASSENLTNFPVLIQLSADNIDYSKTQDNGQDLRFVDADGTTLLDYEIEKWNESGTSYVWVEVPQIDAGSTTDYIWMYYNDSGAFAGANPTGTWNSNYRIVQHLEETGACAVTFTDSTSNAKNGSCVNEPTLNSSGKIGNARTTGIAKGGMSFTDSYPTAFTISFWAKNTACSTYEPIVHRSWDGQIFKNGINCFPIMYFYDTDNRMVIGTTPIINDWFLVTGTAQNNGQLKLYVNGVAEGTPVSVGTLSSENATAWEVGTPCCGSSTAYEGSIDEFRVSTVVRSAEWIEAEYLFTNDNTKYTYGSEETAASYKDTANTTGGAWSSSGNASVPLTRNLVAYWNMDESSGTRNDSWGSNHLTDNNTVTSGSGKVGNAADFELDNTEYLSIPDNASLSTGDIDFTVAGWVNFENLTNGVATLAIKGSHTNNPNDFEWAIEHTIFKDLKFIVGGTEINEVGTGNDSITATNQWYFFVAWHDSVNNQIGIQLNNNAPATVSHSTGITDRTWPFQIGGSMIEANRQLDGKIDEFGFWKRVLSSAERTALYNSGNGLGISQYTATARSLKINNGVDPANLVSFWEMEEASGTRADAHGSNDLTENDSVGNTTGKVGNAADFTNVNQKLTVNDNADLSVGSDDDFSIAFWTKLISTPETNSNRSYVYKGVPESASHEYFVNDFYDGSRKFLFRVCGAVSSTNCNDVIANAPPTINQWIFVVAWHDAGTNTINIQIDNGTPNSTNHTHGGFDGAGEFAIRRANLPVNEVMDQVGFWKRILTSDERTALYNSGNGLSYSAMTNVSSNSTIGTATLTKNDTAGSGTVTYYLSNNGGSTWEQVTPGSPHTFGSSGTDLRFRVDITGNATVQDVTVSVSAYHTTADLTSSAYNTANAVNLVSKLAWTDSGTTGSRTIKFQIRSAPDDDGSPGEWSDWCGYDDCSGTNYFESGDNNDTLASDHPLRNGADDQWFQYKLFIATDGTDTPSLLDVSITYVVNTPPEFDTTYPGEVGGEEEGSSLTNDLVSFWELEEASGTRNDAHGSNHLVQSGTVGSGSGKVGTAADFEASNFEYLSVADNPGISAGDNDFTFAAWVRPESITTYSVIAQKGWGLGDNVAEWVLYIDLDGTWVFSVTSFGNAGNVRTISTASTNTWYYVVAWHDATTNQIGLQINNGTPVTISYSGGVDDGTGAFQIGASQSQSLYWDGLIDQAGFWKRTLSSDERTALYNSGNGLSYADLVEEGGGGGGEPGVFAEQIMDSSDPNYGKVEISYRIRDADTNTGTNTPGYVTPSFQYNIGGGWVNIGSGNLASGDTDNKAVDDNNFTTYTATWNAPAQITNNYLTTAKVRVTINDNEAANNTATATSDDFTLDTKVPVISAFRVDGTLGQLTVTATDDNDIQYMISNNSDYTEDGVNGTSGQWQTPNSNSINVTPAWNLPENNTVYLKIRDSAGNTTTTSTVAPSTPGNMNIKDISIVETESYREFISWSPYTPVAGAAFGRYELYRSTDGSSFTSLTNITNIETNYYADTELTAGQTYYYKVRVLDSTNDLSNFSSVVSDMVDGQDGTDLTPPTISEVMVTEQQASYVTITWTTNELSDSRVDFSISPSTSFGSGQTKSSFVTEHSVTVRGLQPETTYLFRVKSTDAFDNTGTNDNGGEGFTFTTVGGPIISNVTETSVDENSATIAWNTDVDSDSFVTYSINPDLSASTTVGSSELVGGSNPFQHSVVLEELVGGTTYYYFVESTDAQDNTSRDNNGNQYYSFNTTVDNIGPEITNITTPVIAPTAAVIVWKTDELATTQLLWGTAEGELTEETTLDGTLTIFHIVPLNDLEKKTTYYYKVKSADSSGNESESGELSFETGEIAIIEVITVVNSGGGGSSVVLDKTPPSILNPKQPETTAFGATVSFDTDEDSIGLVQYGLTQGNLDQSAATSDYGKTHTIQMKGLKMGTTYYYKTKAIDKAGNMTIKDPLNFSTKFFTESSISIDDAEAFQNEVEGAIEAALPSLVAPFIEKPIISEVTDSRAKITWRTNTKTYASVEYATDNEYNQNTQKPYTTEISNLTEKTTTHEIILRDLNPNTRYHLRAKGFSLPQLIGASADVTFVTKALSIQAQIGEISNNSFKVSWRTNEPTSSIVEYRNTSTGVMNQKALNEQATNHEIFVDNLTPATTYEVSVYGINSKGNRVQTANAVRITTSKDTLPPEITSLKIDTAIVPGRNDRTQTIVSWKTNENSTSTVYYEEGTGVTRSDKPLANKVEIKNSYVLDHAVVLSTLKPGGLYRIQVSSTDSVGNSIITPVKTIVIPRESESIMDVIFKNFEDTFKFLRQVGR